MGKGKKTCSNILERINMCLVYSLDYFSKKEYIQEYLGTRPDLQEYEEYLNDQMRAFDEREHKVSNNPLQRDLTDQFILK